LVEFDADAGLCSDCGYERTGPTPSDDLARCQKCGSANQNISVSLPDDAKAREMWALTIRVDRFPGRRKLQRTIFAGSELRKSTGDFVQKERITARDTNEYIEPVREESGEIIHYVHEPLTEHFAHGSVRFKKPKPDA
jgi:hypothetical protein